MKAFVDSNVFISAIQDEFGSKLEFMIYRTEEFFERVMQCLHVMVISESVIGEISKRTLLSEQEIWGLFSKYENKINMVQTNPDDLDAAKMLDNKYRIGETDALHFVLAVNSQCDCIVTWNRKHFECFSERIKIFKPGEL